MQSVIHVRSSWPLVLVCAVTLWTVPGRAAESNGAGQAQSEQKQGQTQAAMTATAGDIARSPEKYYGKRVSVTAEVEDIIGPQTFLLDEDRLFAWPDVMVITPTVTLPVPEDQTVTVTGTVRRFVDAELRREYAWNWWRDWDVDVAASFRDRPVIMADSVKASTGMEYIKK